MASIVAWSAWVVVWGLAAGEGSSGAAPQAVAERMPVVVPTFSSASLYWSPAEAASQVAARVRYRRVGAPTWRQGHDLCFNPAENGRADEYRGSIVGLQPATTYEVSLQLNDAAAALSRFTTWTERFPIARTVTVEDRDTPLEISGVHGSDAGYILYTGPATIDVTNQYDYNIRVTDSSYLIIRGMVLKGAKGDGILLGPHTKSNGDRVHDIVIEDNDISAWGTVHPNAPSGSNWGYDDQSGVRSSSSELARVVVQRNRIHHPRTDSNSWKERNPIIDSYHPCGPQGITFENGSKGSFVIRFNEIFSDNDHRFNDGMGSDANFGYGGFPISDSDIYGNVVTHTWDDGIESEGANMNVRIWGNYTDETYTGVALAGVTMGPLYVFRNVFQHSRTSPEHPYGGSAFKRGGSDDHPSDGRIYFYNNTLFYNGTPAFQSGISNRTDDNFASNTVARNNILQIRGKRGDKSVYDPSPEGSYDYDLYNGAISAAMPSEQHGQHAVPVYVAGAGFDPAAMKGIFQLRADSPGYDGGTPLANFTDGYRGRAPDVGAHEAGDAPMRFGVNQ